jgi:copper(I)-binding protein
MLDILAAIIRGVSYLAVLGGAGIVIAAVTLPGDARSPARAIAMLVRGAGGLAMLCAALTAWLFVARLGGIADPAARDAVAWSPVGAALALQFLGGAMLAALSAPGAMRVGAIVQLLSFAVVGHSATLGPVSALTVLVHVTAAAWWLGGLVLLRMAGTGLPHERHVLLVAGFSRQAIWVVAALLLAATLTAAMLLDRTVDLGRTYDRGLALKAALSSSLLALAGINRFALLPRLAAGSRPARWLARTIVAELLIIAAILATTAWLTGFQSPHKTDHAASAPPPIEGPVAIIDAWAPASVSGLGTGAGYLTIVNNQDADDRLIGASSPWADALTLHQSRQNGGIVRMQKIASLRLPAHQRTILAPGGHHLMFTGLYSPLVAGDSVPVTLTFARAGTISIMLKVGKIGDPTPHRH